MADGLKGGGEETGVAPRERGEAEVEDAVEFVDGDAHVEAGFGGGEAGATGVLHDRERIEVKPPDGLGINRLDGALFVGFETGAEGGDAIFDEVEPGALHDVVFVVVGGGDDFLGDAEGVADFGAGEFAVFEELEVGAGEGWANDFEGVGEEERAVGGTGTAPAAAEFGEHLFALEFVELFGGADDGAEVAVVFEEAAHEGGGCEVGFGGEAGDGERGEAAPEVKGVGEFIVPDFFGEKDLGRDGGALGGCGVAPAEERVVFDDVLEICRVENQDVAEGGALDWWISGLMDFWMAE